MPAVDSVFLVIFVLLIGTLMMTNFLQARTNMKLPYQNYFGVLYLAAFIFLLFSGWQSMRP